LSGTVKAKARLLSGEMKVDWPVGLLASSARVDAVRAAGRRDAVSI
jgi:hypothetical protein